MSEPPWTERKEAVVVENPTARKFPSRKRLDEARDWLNQRGWKVEWLETAARGDATSIATDAARRGVPLLFVCGGDGTLNEAVNGLAGSETALAVIPAGTVNLWAREIGLLKNPVEAIRVAVEGARRRIDLGRAGERYFLLMAGFGLDATVAHGVSHRIKDRFGATAYALSAAREALRYRSSPVTLSLDGQERALQLLMLIVGNTRKYAGLTEITPAAVVDDGRLDVCAYTGRGRLDILWLALLTLIRQQRRSRKVVVTRVRKLRIDGGNRLAVQLDGDAIKERPAEVMVAPGALWVAVPAALKSPLFSGRPLLP
jgi:YegS/Rv2252/BmrU family lipid kinase